MQLTSKLVLAVWQRSFERLWKTCIIYACLRFTSSEKIQPYGWYYYVFLRKREAFISGSISSKSREAANVTSLITRAKKFNFVHAFQNVKCTIESISK